MFTIIAGSTQESADTKSFIDLMNHPPEDLRDFFAAGRELIVARAPGRLDLMGGIADYSGSLVLQLPIAAATHAALQRRNDRIIQVVSLSGDDETSPRKFTISIDDLIVSGEPVEYALARDFFGGDPANHWASYVVGAFPALMRERGVVFDEGANILIRSDVPEGKGVSSSAALEVAAMQAIAGAYEIDLDPRELALLCQKVENLVAGAPCGVMDQMTAACGEADRLLALLCQPCELQSPVKLPADLSVWGIDSGVRHAVSGADYGSVRTAAFMGYRMIAEMAGLRCRETETEGRVLIDDPRWRGYLANLTTEEFERGYAGRLPQTISGDEFLDRYRGITDAVTSAQRGRIYPVYRATAHPIYEHARVGDFRGLLDRFQGIEDAARLGELMYQSHESYSACGLGSDGTDEIVRLVREAGIESGLYGAKITGGGSGGTVAVLGRRGAQAAVETVAGQYAERTDRRALVISGSSPGAGVFGRLKLKKE